MMFSETDSMLKVIIKPDAERIKLSSFCLWTINCYIRVTQAQCHILSVFVFNATQALSFSSGEGVHADFQKLNADINSPSASYILKLANRLYGENTAHFLPDFLDATQKYYQADLKTVDFIGAPEACRAEINSWVEQQTENKIKDLLKPETVETDTRLVLVNAVYFKGNWKNPFKEANTKEMPFKIKQNETVPVQMMYQEKKLPYNYIADHDLQILELPYVGEELSMFILLPKESSGPLLKLEKELTQERLNEWTDRKNMSTRSEVVLHLPKFKLEEDYKLNDPLAKLGMKDVFCAGRADLSGMNGDGGLFLSTVAHKAFVEVNEEGTEAAAATGVVSMILCGGWTQYFTADHPFLFFIRHNETKSILFFGRFSSPQ
ncbi:leukocyte elastase inhibitor-like isoform X2 [Simochromis diagramma]|uniref:leukocyte elastase inhibitor-like isoform X2 n=1 Tax=Simochromis diagramma TaxID=43689 RepID=UPI001A7E3EB4|nr:leukocyte elastase inhibitor-like isoform X2 [Simochromis diagramma]